MFLQSIIEDRIRPDHSLRLNPDAYNLVDELEMLRRQAIAGWTNYRRALDCFLRLAEAGPCEAVCWAANFSVTVRLMSAKVVPVM